MSTSIKENVVRKCLLRDATSKFGQMPHLLINSIYGRSRNEGAANLCALADKIDTTKMKHPSFLMVLTGVGDYAYKRPEDGVLVVPIGSLKD